MRSAVHPELSPRRVMLYGLGGLWLFDGILQMQPGMFTMDMVSTIMQPAATGEPHWLSALINWSINATEPHLALFNWSVVVLQLAIGALLLMPRRKMVVTGLWLSIVWGLLVWVFGEGLGQILTGSATFLTGAPGSVLLYVAASVLLLLEERESWWRGHRVDAATWIVAATLVFGGLLQFTPVFWTGLGLASPFGSGAMMAQPHVIGSALALTATLVSSVPVLANAVIIALTLGFGAGLVAFPRSRFFLWSTFIWLALTWWLGQDLGMLFGGMATDPNTAPVLALLLWAGWTARRQPAAAPESARLHGSANAAIQHD